MKQLLIAFFILAFGALLILRFQPDLMKAQFSLDDAAQEANLEYPDALPTVGTEDANSPVEATESFLLNYVVNPTFYIAGGVAVVMLIFYVGRLLIFTPFSEEGLEAAKKNATWIFVGLLLIVGSYTIVRNIIFLVMDRLT